MQNHFPDALASLSMLDVLKFVPVGQKVVVLSEDEDGNLGVVLSQEQRDQFADECQLLGKMTVPALSNDTPLWNHLVAENVVALQHTPKGVALQNPRSGCSVVMPQDMWASLASGVKAFELSSNHTEFDDAVLVGFLNRIPSHKIQKAFEWCQSKGNDPWGVDKDNTPTWLTVVEGMDHMSPQKENPKEVTVVQASQASPSKIKR